MSEDVRGWWCFIALPTMAFVCGAFVCFMFFVERDAGEHAKVERLEAALHVAEQQRDTCRLLVNSMAQGAKQ